MNRFDCYTSRVLEISTGLAGDAREAAVAVRSLTKEALTDTAFILECTDRVVTDIERAGDSWHNPPLFSSRRPEINLCIFYWPPREEK